MSRSHVRSSFILHPSSLIKERLLYGKVREIWNCEPIVLPRCMKRWRWCAAIWGRTRPCCTRAKSARAAVRLARRVAADRGDGLLPGQCAQPAAAAEPTGPRGRRPAGPAYGVAFRADGPAGRRGAGATERLAGDGDAVVPPFGRRLPPRSSRGSVPPLYRTVGLRSERGGGPGTGRAPSAARAAASSWTICSSPRPASPG